MKKVLFATTALIATAGMAAAEVNISGGGRLGLVYSSGNGASAPAVVAAARAANAAAVLAAAGASARIAAGTGTAADYANVLNAATTATALSNALGSDALRYEMRMTINIDGSGETDNGLTYGGRIRLRSDEGRTNTRVAQGNIFIGNDTWRVTVGNTDGAMLNRVNFFQGSVGLTGIGYNNVSFNMGTTASGTRWNLNSYSSGGNAGQVIRLDFNVGDFGVSLSSDVRGSFAASGTLHEDSIAASYNFGDWTVAAGYANNASGTANMWSASVNGSIGDFGVGIQYSDLDNVAAKVVLNGSYSFGDTNVTAFVSNTSWETAAIQAAAGSTEDTEYGIGFTHSLGGATLAGGVTRNFAGNTAADLGVRFSF